MAGGGGEPLGSSTRTEIIDKKHNDSAGFRGIITLSEQIFQSYITLIFIVRGGVREYHTC